MHRPCRASLVLALVPFVAGCQQRQATIIRSEPAGALVSVDKTAVGNAPAEYTFDFRRKPNYVVSARLPGYFEAERVVGKDTPGVRDALLVALQPDEAWTATTRSEATNTWLRIQVNRAIDREGLWLRLTDAVTGRYVNMEVLDEKSGYMRSAAKTQAFSHPTKGAYTVRTQFVGSIAETTPLVYKLMIVSDLTDSRGNTAPFDRIFKADAQLVEELQGRLGLK
jgi:hypothetical protein